MFVSPKIAQTKELADVNSGASTFFPLVPLPQWNRSEDHQGFTQENLQIIENLTEKKALSDRQFKIT